MEYRFGRKTGSRSSQYSTGLALWNIASVEKLDLCNTAPKPRQGEGRLVDISYGGASLVVEEPLGERGFLQLRFQLHKHPMRMMLEALSCTPMAEGRFLLRGQFRGPGEEARIRLNNTLTREQIKRLREKELLRYTPGG